MLGFVTFIDTDGDGSISPKEFETVFKRFGQNLSQAELDSLLRKADKDGDGSIKFEEFLDVVRDKLRAADPEEGILQAFSAFDKDNTGYISAAQLRHIMTTLGETLSDEEVDEMIREATENNNFANERINYREFTRMMMNI